MITTVLFDLDGTLLPMDQDAFTRGYFKLLAAKLAPHGYEPKQLVEAIWAGTEAMVRNDGSRNEAAFWDKFASIYGEKAKADEPLFVDFYANEFNQAQSICRHGPLRGGDRPQPAKARLSGGAGDQFHLPAHCDGKPHPLGGTGAG